MYQHTNTRTQASSNVYKTLDVRLARYFRIQIPGKRRGGVRKRRKGGRYLIRNMEPDSAGGREQETKDKMAS